MIPTELTQIIYFSLKKEQMFSKFEAVLPLKDILAKIKNNKIDERIVPNLATPKNSFAEFALKGKRANYWFHLTIFFNILVSRIFSEAYKDLFF